MEYYAAMRMNKLLLHTTKWMDHKNKILSERSQYILFDSIYRKFKNRQN